MFGQASDVCPVTVHDEHFHEISHRAVTIGIEYNLIAHWRPEGMTVYCVIVRDVNCVTARRRNDINLRIPVFALAIKSDVISIR